MEQIVFHSIMHYLDQNKILNNYQHGFRHKHSCQSQLVMLTEEILKAMDQQKQIDLILLDFYKAFDSVPHKHLFQKLSHYGIRRNLHQWIKAWLTQCKQREILNNVTSNFVPVKSVFRKALYLAWAINVPAFHQLQTSTPQFVSLMTVLFTESQILKKAITSYSNI